MLSAYDSYRGFLSAELVRRMRSNPNYSMRSFARSLGLSAGELSEVLRGKRKLSLRSAERISNALGLSAAEKEHLQKLVVKDGGNSVVPRLKPSSTMTELSLDIFAVVSDWYCFAILNLAETEDFRWDESYIARRLGIAVPEARLALQRLVNVGLIEPVRGKFRIVKGAVMAPEGIPSEAIRAYHRQILSKAAQALDTQSLDEREIAGVSFAVNPKLVPQLKRELSGFLDYVAEKYGAGKSRTEVYHAELALFKLTKGDPDAH